MWDPFSFLQDPVMDDPELEDNNVRSRVDGFIRAAQNQARFYETEHVLVTMGADFTYQAADTWFKNMDKLIRHVNARVRHLSPSHCFAGVPSPGLDIDTVYTTREL